MIQSLLNLCLKTTFLCISLILLSAVTARGQEPTFLEVQRIAGEAATHRAALLSPSNFREGSRYWQQACADSGNQQRDKKVQSNLNLAYEAFGRAIIKSNLAVTVCADMIAAWDSAQARNASHLATQNWEKGSRLFQEAIAKFEAGDYESAKKVDSAAVLFLRQAELEAIQTDLLGSAREAAIQLKAAKAQSLAPISYQKAIEAILFAEEAISTDRYAWDDNRELADRAEYAVRHAQYMADWINRLKKENTWEPLLLEFEGYLANLAAALSVSVQFDRGFGDPVEILRGDLRSLLETRNKLQKEGMFKDSLIGFLEAENQKLLSQSGRYALELESKRQELERKKQFEEKVNTIKALFNPSDGVVLVEGSQIIIRLTGLIFPSNKADLKRDNFYLLDRLGQALLEITERTVEIQGHTDSQGKEEKNQELSLKRAQAVCDYLVKKTGLPENRIQTIGFGSTKPVASNDKAAGRELNRRIEIILKP